MTKKSKVNKLTESLREKIKTEFVQGVELQSGERKIFTKDELIKKHKVASATLYRAARAENWKALREQFNAELQQELNEQRKAALIKEGKSFDDKFLQKAAEICEQVEEYFKLNQQALAMKSRAFPPQHLLALCNALTVAQKLSKVALGEVTENINVNTTIKEAESFRRIMDLLDGVKAERINSDSESLH